MKPSKRKAPNVSPGDPELQRLAGLAGIPPARLAGALRDPKHLTNHITHEELVRAYEASDRLGVPTNPQQLAFRMQVVAALKIAAEHMQKTKTPQKGDDVQ